MDKLEPPTFISETKSFETYKRDLERWTKLTKVKAEQQALVVVHHLDGHESGIKENIDNGVKETDLECKEGIQNLLKFLEGIYKKDTISDAFNKFKTFTNFRRKSETPIQSFIADWSTTHRKAKAVGCDMSDKILAFLLLDAANISSIDRNLVLTGVDYESGETNKDLLTQMHSALKKFVGRAVVSDADKKEDSTYLTSHNFEQVLMSKGWTKANKGKGKRERTRSNSLPENLTTGK